MILYEKCLNLHNKDPKLRMYDCIDICVDILPERLLRRYSCTAHSLRDGAGLEPIEDACVPSIWFRMTLGADLDLKFFLVLCSCFWGSRFFNDQTASLRFGLPTRS